MRERTITALLIVFLAGTLSVACGRNHGSGSSSKKSNQACAAFEDAATAPNGSGALIVTDISGSMKGFAQPGSVRLFAVHDALEKAVRNAIAASDSSTIRRCYLGDKLDCNTRISMQAMDSPGTYSATESRLDLFMTNAANGDPKPKEAQDPIDPYSISVLITDGMQARSPDSKSGGPCLDGADPDCIAHLLKQRVSKGYGVWMALLLLPFKGTHFAEQPLDNARWQRVQQHISSLARDPYLQGVSCNVTKTGAGATFKSYSYQGVKPLLVLVLSRDRQLGRNFLQQFTGSIRKEGVVQPASAVYSMELAPLSVRPRQVAKISLAPQSPVQGVRPITQKRQGGVYDYLVECDANGSATFVVSWEDKEGTQAVPDGITVDYKLVPSNEGDFPQGRMMIGNATEKGFEARLSCQQIREGAYEAWFKLEAEMKADPNTASFWSALHADNMYEAPERLYGLKDLVQSVLLGAIEQPRVTDCIRFRIERK